MGNCCSVISSRPANADADADALPINTTFSLPSPLPPWPPGSGFATGTIDLGGLLVSEIETASLRKIWATYDNEGATFLEPAAVPQGFFMLGCCIHPNNRPLSVSLLCARDDTPDAALLNKPIDYALLWNSSDRTAFIWLPLPPDGYKALGHVVTTSPEKPSLDKIRCVRSDFTDDAQPADSWIWGNGHGIRVSALIPRNRGSQAMAVPVGSFIAQTDNSLPLPLACLKNVTSNLHSMPNLPQIRSLFQTYAPRVYFHPDEQYLPSSVTWFFQNGALLYKKGEESSPVLVEATGSNLPQGGSNDGAYWLDLPPKPKDETVKKSDLRQLQVYLHVKPMLGATCTDIAVWIFYPFNGPARAKVELINLPLGKIGQHVGDWEHFTLRISNFNAQLQRMYFSQHSGGSWVEASELEFAGGSGNNNKPVAYSSLHGHAMYPKPGLVLQGSGGIGIRNDTAKSNKWVDTENNFSVVAAEYLGDAVVEPPWLDYAREWGPKINYDLAEEIREVDKVLPGKLKSAFDKVIKGLPNEVLGEEGPTGPKMKASWDGDEKV